MPGPPDIFRRQVYAVVRKIPMGCVGTYGQIAGRIPPPPGTDPLGYVRIRARWVGYALADCPEDVPWQRVVNAQGRVSPRPGHGPHVQRILLEEEGVLFSEAGRVDLGLFGWAPDVDRAAFTE